MKVNIELDLDERQLNAFFIECLIGLAGCSVNGVDLAPIYEDIRDQLREQFTPEIE